MLGLRELVCVFVGFDTSRPVGVANILALQVVRQNEEAVGNQEAVDPASSHGSQSAREVQAAVERWLGSQVDMVADSYNSQNNNSQLAVRRLLEAEEDSVEVVPTEVNE